MPDAVATEVRDDLARRDDKLPAMFLLLLLVGVAGYAFRTGLIWAWTDDWPKEEYNHCYLIPLISCFLVATRAREFVAVPWNGSPWGVALVAASFLMLLLGELGSIITLTQYGFIVAVWGCFIAVLGWPAVKTIWPALFYLVFMVAIPDFFQVKLTADMQLVSTKIGVAIIRLAGVPVYVEGNVIDLGSYQLAVVEACSGLRYLFPLTSFGFLCAVLFEAPAWQRAVVFLSTVPITILMNSVRIGIIGILVAFAGIEQAEGFLHDFEGWAVFMVCVGILFLEMFVMARLSGRRLLKTLRMDTPPLGELYAMLAGRPARRAAAVAATVAVLAGTAVAGAVGTREVATPERASLVTFPLALGEWRGVEQPLEEQTRAAVGSDDELAAVFVRGSDPVPVALWIAYYAAQRSGHQVHSPSTCLPGGGWQMVSLETVEVPGVRADGTLLPVNRSIIAKDDLRQLVYYWFPQRGRLLTNEYLVKWFIILDGVTMNRSDGALVRLTTPIDDSQRDGLEQADARLREFARTIDPKLNYFLPQKDAVLRVASGE
jgi:exosortase D (VPLPA-CTERM-specific)